MVEIVHNFQMKRVDCQSSAEKIYRLLACCTDPVVFITDNGCFQGALNRDIFLREDCEKMSGQGWKERLDPNYPVIRAEKDDPDKLKLEAIRLLNQNAACHLIPVLSGQGEILYGFRRIVRDRHTEECGFYAKYTLLLQAGYSIGDYLRMNDIHTVSIYGADELAVLLYNDLASYPGIEIKRIINHREMRIGNMQSILWKDITQEVLDSTQLLIVTYVHTHEGLSFNLRKRGFKNLISLQNVVTELYSYVYEIKPMLDKLVEFHNNGIAVYYAHFPILKEVVNPSPREQFILSHNIGALTIRENFERYEQVVLQGSQNCCTKEELKKWSKINIPLIYKSGYAINVDVQTPLYNIINGHRITTDVPSNAEHCVHFFGRSWTFGPYVHDHDTIESFFQRILNHREKSYKAINYGVNGMRLNETLFRMNDAGIKEGDIIILIANQGDFEKHYCSLHLPFINLSSCVNRPHDNGELYIESGHVNSKGNELMATALYHEIFEKNAVNMPFPTQVQMAFNYYGVREKSIAMRSIPVDNSLENNRQFLDFLEFIKTKRAAVGGKIGSIVMNCNPFTNGHRYLIETASRQVDHLYIFVVEEDKSVFPFRDRMDLVKKGTADLPNVTVLPSGKFIISSLTFPGYFLKGEKNDATVDTTQDLTLFAQKIAPTLGITVRFAGNEPSDNITRQYNEQMAKLLPRYGIQFVEIPRKEAAGRPISASTVRALLKEQLFEDLKEIVPPTTFDYLRENHTKLHDTVHKS